MPLYESFQNVISSFGMKELTQPIFYNCKIGIRFNIGDNVLLHLYDDRGADLISDKKEKIQHLYYKLNNLILNFDREKIDNIFKSTVLE